MAKPFIAVGQETIDILKALGMPTELCCGFHLHFPIDGAAWCSVKYLISDEAAQRLVPVIKNHKLTVEREEDETNKNN